MTHKKASDEALYGRLVVIVTALAILTAYIFGCAHTCRTPEERAAQYGTVLECKPAHVHGKSDQARCLVSTPSGDTYYHFKVCE